MRDMKMTRNQIRYREDNPGNSMSGWHWLMAKNIQKNAALYARFFSTPNARGSSRSCAG